MNKRVKVAPLIIDPESLELHYGSVDQPCKDDGLEVAIITIDGKAILGLNKKTAKSLVRRLRSFIKGENLEPYKD